MISRPELRGAARYLILVFSLLAVGIGIAGYLYYEGQQRAVKQEEHDDLVNIAELKVSQISWWLRERLGDANGIYNNSLIATEIHRWMTSPSAAGLREPILGWMTSLKKDYDYRNVFLFDARGRVKLSVPGGDRYVGRDAQALISEALRTRKVVLSDLYLSEDRKSVHMDLVIPLFLGEGNHMQSVGGLLLCIDPRAFLYPLIRSWSASSRTAETVLVRREGNDVVYLNELRHRSGAPLTLRFPVTEKRLIVAMAVRGAEGIAEGVDYRGVPVIAAIRRVPGTSWFLIAKVDVDEMYAPIRERFWLVVILVSAFIAGAGAWVGLIWRHQGAMYYRKQYEAESAYRTVFENTGTATTIVEEDTTISLVNSEFEKLSGYSKEELEGRKSWTEFFAEDDLERAQRYFYQDMADPNPHPKRFEFRFVDRNGSIKHILASVAVIPGTKKGVGSFLDITERKRAEESLRQSEQRFRSYVEVTGQLGWTTNVAGEVVEDIPSWRAYTGQTFDEIKGWGWSKVLHPDDVEEVAQTWKKAITEKSAYEVEYRVRRDDGIYRHFLARGIPVFKEDGSIREWVGTCIDITERKQAEDALRRAKDELEILVDERTSELKKSNETLTREIIEHMRTEEALRESQKELRYLSGKIIFAQETERGRIARELHDQLGQDLTLMKLQMRAVQRKAGADQEEFREGCEEILGFVDQVVENVRRLSRNLSPVALSEFGLSSAIRGLISSFMKTYDARVSSDVADIDRLFTKDVQFGIYRVLQEAFINIGKHARAKNVSVVIRTGDEKITFSVEDDGVGFNVERADKSARPDKGMGLSIMKERVQMLGGSLDLWSEEGKGTKVAFSIPLGKREIGNGTLSSDSGR